MYDVAWVDDWLLIADAAAAERILIEKVVVDKPLLCCVLLLFYAVDWWNTQQIYLSVRQHNACKCPLLLYNDRMSPRRRCRLASSGYVSAAARNTLFRLLRRHGTLRLRPLCTVAWPQSARFLQPSSISLRPFPPLKPPRPRPCCVWRLCGAVCHPAPPSREQ